MDDRRTSKHLRVLNIGPMILVPRVATTFSSCRGFSAAASEDGSASSVGKLAKASLICKANLSKAACRQDKPFQRTAKSLGRRHLCWELLISRFQSSTLSCPLSAQYVEKPKRAESNGDNPRHVRALRLAHLYTELTLARTEANCLG